MCISDSNLIQSYQKGDESALSFLIERHQKALYSFIFFKIRNEDLANDIFQETFIKIIVKLKKGEYKEEGKFILWAKRIAYNMVIDHFRAQSKNPSISESTYAVDGEFSIFDVIKDPSGSIEDQIEEDQIVENIHKMIHYLPKNQQEIIKLRFYDGLSFKEIAEQNKNSINTNLGRMRYALLNLRKLMTDHQLSLTKQ